VDTSTWIWIAVAIVVIALLVLVLVLALRSRRQRQQLQSRFGPEYDRTLEDAGKRRDGERELRERIDLRDRADVRPLTPAARERFVAHWQETQARFVDRPALAVLDADALVSDVMRERGYPVDDWDQQASVVSVDHPRIAQDYRAAHDIAQRSREGSASTEDLREAFLRYRSLFDALLETDSGERDTTSATTAAGTGSGGGAPSTPWERPPA
jgi:hypothetical protein